MLSMSSGVRMRRALWPSMVKAMSKSWFEYGCWEFSVECEEDFSDDKTLGEA